MESVNVNLSPFVPVLSFTESYLYKKKEVCRCFGNNKEVILPRVPRVGGSFEVSLVLCQKLHDI